MTNRQYLIFVEALAGRGPAEAVAAAQQLLPLMAQQKQTPEQFRPYAWPGMRYRAGEGNHPVVGVTWYGATAFAWWANAWLHALGALTPDEALRLPTEAEWEQAAAYPPTLPGANTRAGRREYPWGAWPNLTNTTARSMSESMPANTSDSNIGNTSAVGKDPHSAAACAAEDLAGNVWEWCSTPMLPYPFKGELNEESLYSNRGKCSTYVLCGGSWLSSQNLARCAFRARGGSIVVLYGFRLALLFSLPSF